jgi:hypothetical protein
VHAYAVPAASLAQALVSKQGMASCAPRTVAGRHGPPLGQLLTTTRAARAPRRGYNTAAEREAARHMAGVRVLSLEQGCALLRWGVAAGVSPWGRAAFWP